MKTSTSTLLSTEKVECSVGDLVGEGCSGGRERAMDQFSRPWSSDLG